MVAHAEAQAVLLRQFGPDADDVLLRTDLHRVPRLVRAVVTIEIVVVVGQRHEVARAGPLVESHQLFGVPVLGFPGVVVILEAEFGLRAMFLQAVLVVGGPFHVHVARVPIALLGDALRRPMRPDAELSVAEPFRALVVLDQGIPSGFKRPLGQMNARTAGERRLGSGQRRGFLGATGRGSGQGQRGCAGNRVQEEAGGILSHGGTGVFPGFSTCTSAATPG